jgi:DNA-binding response OmpR family regulator
MMSSACSIFIVDDEPILRQTLSAILQRKGYQVSTAASIQEASQILAKGGFDLVFLDLKMPGGGGMELLPEIRKQYPEMPVVILTAHATLDSAMGAVRMGASDYLLKPIDPERLLERVGEILSQQKLPSRRRKIVSQIEDLLGELHQIDGSDTFAAPSSPAGSNAPTSDPSRYLYCGGITLDLHTRRVAMKDQDISIPPSSFDYLVTLVRHSPNPVSFVSLVTESQGFSPSRAEAREMARVHIHELRKAMEPDLSNPHYIITVRNVGYSLVT